MTVKLDDDGRPLAWGGEVDGQNIPEPPEPARDHRWTGSEWVNDPSPRPDAGAMPRQKLADALAEGQIGTRTALIELLRRGRQK